MTETGKREVSVVIPHYGEVRPTADLVEALLSQVDDVDLDFIVVDDMSPESFPDGTGYRVVRRDRNGGYGAACNSGAAVARQGIVAFLNSDLTVEDDFLSAYLDAAAPWQPAVVAPAVIQPGRTVTVARRLPRTSHYVVEWLVPLARFTSTRWWRRAVGQEARAGQSTVDAAQVTEWVVGACHMVPLADFRAVGGFDERYHMNFEEVDLHRRLRQERGLPVVALRSVSVTHAGGGSSDPARATGWLLDSRFRYAHKWGGAASLLVGLSVASGVNFVWNLQRQARGKGVDAQRRFQQEMGWIMHGWRGRRG